GNFKGTNPWKYAELYVSTGPGISSLEVMLQVGNYGELNSGKAWFDDVEVIKVNSIPSGAVVTVVSKKKDTADSEVKKETQNTPKETKNQGTFIFFIIVIIIVVLTGAAVVVFILVTRKKKGMPDTDETDEDTPDEET
ncbi:MAG: hypothetical protein JXJ04_10430, partial [Spirochaetales bacterium]|nr:hypothetical protein [Spirochaetales bacterium]